MRRFSALAALTLCLLLFPLALPARAGSDCLDCHRQKTPAAVRQWEQSAHAKASVGCADCHGSDHKALEKGLKKVGAAVCGRCHRKAFREQEASRHGRSLRAGRGCTRNQPNRDRKGCVLCHEKGSLKPLSQVECARFLKQTKEMQSLGCNRCHEVETSCASCHTSHLTDLAIVRAPRVCAKCHMGPDHPQWEMWQTSQHGALYRAPARRSAPTASAATCRKAATTSPGASPQPPGWRPSPRKNSRGAAPRWKRSAPNATPPPGPTRN